MTRLRSSLTIAAGILGIMALVWLIDIEYSAPQFRPSPSGDAEWTRVEPLKNPAFERTEMRMHLGDDPAWALPDHDDRSWTRTSSRDLPAREGVFWLRWRLRGPGPDERLAPGLYITSVAAYELFWDGELIGRNGTPAGSRDAERPGLVDRTFALTEAQAAPGEHVVAMRLSTYRCGFPHPRSGFTYWITEPAELYAWRARSAVIPTLAAGAMVVLALIASILWLFQPGRRELAWAVLLCLTAAAIQALCVGRWMVNYPADRYHIVIIGTAALHGVMAVSLVGLVVTHLAVARARWWIAATVVAVAVVAYVTPPVRNTEGAFMMVSACAVVAGVAGWRVLQGHAGARYLMIGALATGVWTSIDPRSYTWVGFLPRFLPTMLGATVMLASAARREREEAERTRQMAARLELELLKKNLQPHFLFNTLTALTELVEQRPADAVGLIEDLAGEFRLMASMAAERTVSLAQELALCRAHLRILGVRTGREYRLEAEGVDEDAPVPPALFLTLIENAFSHQRASCSPVVFRLHGTREASGAVHYAFDSPGEIAPARASAGPGGTGLRYVRARLEESFPRRWTFLDGATAQGWRSRITIQEQGATA